MKLNSHTAFNLLGIVCMIVFIGALMLAAWAGLSKAGIIITGVVAMMIGDFAAIIVVKQLFGGIGKNLVNPAITAQYR